MSLLVTLFLTLTTLLASTIISCPPVVGITSLTAWILIQYIFIVAAMAAYAYILATIRYNYSHKIIVV